MGTAELHILWYILLLLISGIVAGFVSGLFGIGGGIVLVPVLLTVLPYFHASEAVVMHMAVGTSLALILPGSLTASRKQFQLGNLDLKILFLWIQAVIAGAVLGVVLLNYIPGSMLKIYFAVYLLIVTCYGIFKREPHGDEERGPAGWVMRVGGFCVGLISILVGIGGGTFTVPFFHYSHYPLKKSIAISTATGAFISFAGAVGIILDGWGKSGRPPYSLGYLHLPAFFFLTAGMIVFAPMGARAGNSLPNKVLKTLFIGFMALMTGYMFWKAF